MCQSLSMFIRLRLLSQIYEVHLMMGGYIIINKGGIILHHLSLVLFDSLSKLLDILLQEDWCIFLITKLNGCGKKHCAF